MPARRKPQRAAATHDALLREIEEQSKQIDASVEFLRQNAGIPPFANDRASLDELLALVEALPRELGDAADHHIPIYIGRWIVDDFNGHWAIERRPQSAMSGQPYVDGFGNVEHENVYLTQLALHTPSDKIRIQGILKRCRRAFELRASFIQQFAALEGGSILRSEIERQCLELGVLPRGHESRQVWHSRVSRYAKFLRLRLEAG